MDEYDIKKQVEVLNDTLTVIPDTRQRLLKYGQELSEFMTKNYEGYSTEPKEGAEASEEAKRKLILDARQYLKDVPEMLGVPPFEEADGAAAPPRYAPFTYGYYRRRRFEGDFADEGKPEIQIADYRLPDP